MNAHHGPSSSKSEPTKHHNFRKNCAQVNPREPGAPIQPTYLLSRRRGCGRRAGDPSGGERHGEQAPPAPRCHLSGGGEGGARNLWVEIGERTRGAPLSALAGVGEPEAWSVHARGGADLVAADGGGPAWSTAMAGPGLGRAGPSQSIWLGQL